MLEILIGKCKYVMEVVSDVVDKLKKRVRSCSLDYSVLVEIECSKLIESIERRYLLADKHLTEKCDGGRPNFDNMTNVLKDQYIRDYVMFYRACDILRLNLIYSSDSDLKRRVEDVMYELEMRIKYMDKPSYLNCMRHMMGRGDSHAENVFGSNLLNLYR